MLCREPCYNKLLWYVCGKLNVSGVNEWCCDKCMCYLKILNYSTISDFKDNFSPCRYKIFYFLTLLNSIGLETTVSVTESTDSVGLMMYLFNTVPR